MKVETMTPTEVELYLFVGRCIGLGIKVQARQITNEQFDKEQISLTERLVGMIREYKP